MSFKLILLAVAGIIAIAVRFISRMTGKISQNSLVDRLKRNPALVSVVAQELDCPYGKICVTKDVFDFLKGKLTSIGYMGQYKILYSSTFSNAGILLLTELSYKDYVPVARMDVDVSDKAFHNFTLQYNPATSEMTLRSTWFFDTTDKFQKEEFLKCLREMEIHSVTSKSPSVS